MTALLRFANAPAISFCHGWTPWEELPPKFPRILRYVAVDETCRDRLIVEHGIPEERVRLIPNFVDLKRFKKRECLPVRPKQALVFSNYASEDNIVPAIREACARLHIMLDVVGAASRNPANRPESLLGDYDLVFAKGRAALESLAAGAAVVLCDGAGVGPMVTTANMERLRRLNFGIRALRNRHDPDVLSREIQRYDAADATQVSAWIRNTAAMEAVVDKLTALYREVVEEYQQMPPPDRAAEMKAAAFYLRHRVLNLTAQQEARFRHQETMRENETLRDQCRQLEMERQRLQSDLDDVFSSSALRLRNRLVGLPLVGPWLKSLARAAAGRAR